MSPDALPAAKLSGNWQRRIYTYRHLVIIGAIALIVFGAVVCCSFSLFSNTDNFLLVGGVLALGVASWCAGCCCLKTGFKAIREHKNALEVDANRFRAASAERCRRLDAINKRFTEEYALVDDSKCRKKHELPTDDHSRHVCFAIAKEELPVPPRGAFNRSISYTS